MGVREVKKGELIFHSGILVSSLDIVLKGSVQISNPYGSIQVGNGSILGILEDPGTNYTYHYLALEDTSLYSSPYKGSEDIVKVISSNPKISSILVSAAEKCVLDLSTALDSLRNEADSFYHFLKKNYDSYKSLCERFHVPIQSFPYLEEMIPLSLEDELPFWVNDYYKALYSMPSEIKKNYHNFHPSICTGIIFECLSQMEGILSLSNQIADYMYEITGYVINDVGGDFFDLYSNLVFKASQNPFHDTTPIKAAISSMILYLENHSFINKKLLEDRTAAYREELINIEEFQLAGEVPVSPVEKEAFEELNGSLKQILQYADYDSGKSELLIALITQYKNLSDKNSTLDDSRKLRRDIGTMFYEVYESALQVSIMDSNIPVVVRMFFYFGYMDEELAGNGNLVYLYQLAKSIASIPAGYVSTIYDWLIKVYRGEEEPSKNEFDLDYPAYIRELKSCGNIKPEQEKAMLNDRAQKLHFEVQNIFKTGNRITYGRISTFCPVLSEHNILRPLKNMYVSPEIIKETLDKLRAVDFSCFYREVLFSDAAAGVPKEYIQKEVLPNVILTPNIGIRGLLWQEIAGSKRDTPARMLLSIFAGEDLFDNFIRLSGEFRWELCKRIQGVHWNDVTDRSLTSEYCDYVQFYRKNSDLSADAKEKMKIALVKAKNNYRQVFIMDYYNWIKYESNGSPRLNKTARTILFTYCPFPKELRDKAKSNPAFQEIIERYYIKIGQQRHRMDGLIQKLQNTGVSIPEEIRQQKSYLEM